MPSMTRPWEVFDMIKNTAYIKSGDDVDWAVMVDDTYHYVWLIFQESRGSFTGPDWKNNFRFPAKLYKKQDSCMLVHRGYGDAWKSCNDEVMKAFIKLTESYPDCTPAICGWSYGGAMALLAAEDFFYRTHKRAGVITFGAPKPLFGKKTFKYVRSCVQFVYQWTHVNDCVPLLPPFLGYRRLEANYCSSGFCIIKLFRPDIYHQIYGDKDIYEA